MAAVAQYRGKLPATKEERTQAALDIIARYEEGESVYAIAEELGLTNAALYKLMLHYAADEWKEAASAKALANLEDAELRMETAPDALEVTRAREQIKSAQWKLERLLARYFGQQQQAQQAQVVINIAPIRGQVIDMTDGNNCHRISCDADPGSDGPVGEGGAGA